MKIALVTYEFPPDTGKGGIGTYTAQVAALLAARGAAVHVFAGTLAESYSGQENSYTVHRIQSADGFSFKKAVLPFFRKAHLNQPFDIIECPEINSNAVHIKQEYPGIPLVVRLHAPDYLVESLKKTYYPFVTKLRFVLGALRRGKLDLGFWRKYDFKNDPDYQFTHAADAISAPSNTMKHWVVKNWRIHPARIAVLPNPFTPPAPLLALEADEQPGNMNVLFFGRLNVLKGLVNATLAMKQILKEYPQCRFTVVGNDEAGPVPGSSMKEWMQQQLGASIDRVKFREGFDYNQLPTILKDASVVLLPSLFESFSYTCAEAMAAGKAVIGSRNTGMADLIDDGETGLLVNPYNRGELYAALKRLLSQPALCRTMGRQARMAIQQQSDGKQLTEGMLHFYNSCIEQTKHASLSLSQ